jgi:anaerobic selenocysteine-containing dehydrogenase
MAASDDKRLAYRTCPLCEATCGLEITLRGDDVIRIRGDRADVFSEGFICPKGSTLKQLETDPDRLRRPLIRRNGSHEEASWEQAFAYIADRLPPLVAEHGPDAVAVYLGNPNVHTMSGPLYNRVFIRSLGTRSIFSASTVDQMPKHLSSALMFGHPDLIAVPDIDRTDYLLMLGANPVASNGSLATAPDWPGRINRIVERGGSVVVVDPRRTETAAIATEHIAIAPGSDAAFLLAIVNVLASDGLIDLGRLAPAVTGLDEVVAAAQRFTPEGVAGATGIPAPTTRRVAREFAAASRAAAYGRLGTHATRHGTIASWLVDVINTITGNLDNPGGAMFPQAATERPRSPREYRTGRWHSRVGGHPEVRGELPAAALPAEILTSGTGRIRALVSVAGNPVLSNPDSSRVDEALEALDFMVSVDLYLNETSRHADVVLPVPPPLHRPHYDFAFTQLAVRNVVNFSPAVIDVPGGIPDEWETMLHLAAIATGQGPDADIDAFDDFVFSGAVGAAVRDPRSPVHGRDADEIVAATGGDGGPQRWLDFLVRVGPYGEGYGTNPDGLTLAKLVDEPHGIDLGPLQPRLPADLMTADGMIDLAPPMIVDDLDRLSADVDTTGDPGLVLVGRRHVRSNNSWMHNIDVLIRGKERCTLMIHPDDAESRGLVDGASAVVASESGSLEATVEVTAEMMAGVVSLPHGWGHDYPGAELATAQTRPGVNFNRLSTGAIDPLSGNAQLNAIPVTVAPAAG